MKVPENYYIIPQCQQEIEEIANLNGAPKSLASPFPWRNPPDTDSD